MNWEQRYCPNRTCAVGAWMVQRDPTLGDVWLVAAHEDDSPFTVAALDPVCPRCGITLLAVVELDSRRAEPVGAETRPVFNFVRSLA